MANYDNLHSGVLFAVQKRKKSDPDATGSFHWESNTASDARIEAKLMKENKGFTFVVKRGNEIVGRGHYVRLPEPRGNLIATGVMKDAKGLTLYGIKVFTNADEHGRRYHQIRRQDANLASMAW